MDGINDLIGTLSSVGGYVTVVFVVSAFITVAGMLWAWRKINLDEDEAI